ncbi:hypothetical protein PR202_ga12693 [Eleusine coracana subsp. coracana]|uniref:TF-B3 domain-containing protein n=1 Tax=Eleusine coracana subsp. coracana TaxID=191504 RepID=A0AAV5CCS1_ELECO|nr:hypothetical protein PR202_ga12693 [Eleusine coracana subsp. coracana]
MTSADSLRLLLNRLGEAPFQNSSFEVPSLRHISWWSLSLSLPLHARIVPNTFLKHFTGELLGSIKLESPGGCLYDVQVVHRYSKVVLGHGWEAFVDAHYIKENDSLLFRHIEGCCFEVSIFDSDGCEKMFPCTGIKNTPSARERSVDISSSSQHETTESSGSERFVKCEKGKGISSGSESSESGDLVTPAETNYVISRRSCLSEAEKERVIAFIQEIQPGVTVFVAIMQKSHVQPPAAFMMPGCSKKWHPKFCKRKDRSVYMLRGKWLDFVRDNHVQEGDICLLYPTKDATKFTFTIHLLHATGEHAYLESGMHANSDEYLENEDSERQVFARSKKCHPSQSGQSMWNVVASSSSEDSGEYFPSENKSFQIAQGADYVLSHGSSLSEAQKERVLVLMQEIKPETAVFVAIMKKSNVQPPSTCLVISKEYASTHFPHETMVVTLRRPGKRKKWLPRFYKRKDNKLCMLMGPWLDFVRDNHVQEGDICLFLPMKGGRKFTFMVYILRTVASRSRAGTSFQRVGRSSTEIVIKEPSTEGENVSMENDMHETSQEYQECDSDETAGVLQCIKEVIPSENESFEIDDIQAPPGDDYVLSRTSYLSEAQKKRVIALIQKSKPETTVFVAVMRKSNVQPPGPCLGISKEYAFSHFPHTSTNVTLQRRGKNKKWREISASLHRKRVKDDPCLRSICFAQHQLIRDVELVLKVLRHALVDLLQGHLQKSIWKNQWMELGSQYASVHLPAKGQTVVLQCGSKVWETKMMHHTGRRWTLNGGWPQFARDNGLRVGDICLFELKKNERKLTMRVHIISTEQL